MRRATLLTLLVCCNRPAPAPQPWPVFPQNEAARDALIKERTLRPPTPPTDFSPETIFATAQKQGWSTLPSGEPQVYAWISAQRPRWLLFGTFHDSAGQIDAFRRLVGPGGVEGFTHVALEQLRADGRWQGLDGGQRGDNAVLADRAALATAHREHDYTAWKYGYERNVLDLVDARTVPCDAPHTRDERLRELHCLFAVRDATDGGSRIAMLWGVAHVTSEGFRRFLPPAERALSVYAVGARWSPEAWTKALVVDDLVLVPLNEGEAALVLPNGHVDRAKDEDLKGPPSVHAEGPGTLRLGGIETRLPADVPLPDGDYTYEFVADTGLRFVGPVSVHGPVELSFDPATRETRIVTARP